MSAFPWEQACSRAVLHPSPGDGVAIGAMTSFAQGDPSSRCVTRCAPDVFASLRGDATERLCHPRVTAFDTNRAVFVRLSRRNGRPALPSRRSWSIIRSSSAGCGWALSANGQLRGLALDADGILRIICGCMPHVLIRCAHASSHLMTWHASHVRYSSRCAEERLWCWFIPTVIRRLPALEGSLPMPLPVGVRRERNHPSALSLHQRLRQRSVGQGFGR
jgi:hypothetical protein